MESQTPFLLLLGAGGSPWGPGSWLGFWTLCHLLSFIRGQRKGGSTLITHLKKSLDFMLFSYHLLGSYWSKEATKSPE